MTTTRLPLFPLNTVLFPGLVLPLNVFEARYRALLRDLLELPEDGLRPFGVVAIREGREVARTGLGLPDGTPPPDAGPTDGFGPDPMRTLHHVGCIADASTVRERSGTDRGYEVLATGTSRFRLLSVDTGGPYLIGEIEELPEEAGEGAGAVATGVLRAFRAYQKGLAEAHERTMTSEQELPDEPLVVSYLVAAATVLATSDRQRLLEAPDAVTRLLKELALLRRETTLISKLPSVPAADHLLRPVSLN
ncbi:LON peptidase substrate-binding domain-containing protein [Streptomyces sp. ACA25]|uniref:LON peptidase substrate-binding domain-containing protein n=1 Tax=Streptomyces sp. ACA25 TaxID=3022596 RepID=UPI002307A540|nr:LON peptidase substrate-binding domain-containing protein [Streptomyces sp. ACA25]MDB1088647.1 LON peptidase substrate-binding domain-containing protein [Streptomyces sp. ACA25]